MFGIGGPELVVIVVVLLIFVGPEKLPEVMRTVGGGMRDLRRAANLAQAEVKRGLDELSREVEEVTRDVQDTARSVAQDLHAVGRDLEQEATESSAPPRTAATASATKPMEETIEVVRRKSTPPPRLESDPPWAVAAPALPEGQPAEPVAIKRPSFHPPSTPASVLSRDALVVAPAEPTGAAEQVSAQQQVAGDAGEPAAPAPPPFAGDPSGPAAAASVEDPA